jgi:hypothetical protein
MIERIERINSELRPQFLGNTNTLLQ